MLSAVSIALTALMTSTQDPHRPPLPSPEEIAELPADGGDEFNRLVFEHSPYLLQHARNPVDWWPWCEAAFEKARADDKPVFLSIGYSTCHWCHVMEHESFEDEQVAALLDQHFVCIKVDREERPDLDQVYMSVTQALTGSGGWPMTVLLTPDKQPFYAGTYFPKHGRYGRPGMVELVPALSRAWKEDRKRVLESAQRMTEWLRKSSEDTRGTELDLGILGLTEHELADRYDALHGGFGDAPKFPVPHNLRFLLRTWRRTGEKADLDRVLHTLREMRKGGIQDQIGFGFHRYSTDAEWLVPHFEKMLYDQALIAMALIEAWQASGADDLRASAEETFAYVLRDMTSPQGGFYSAEDADSEGVEGLFYLWKREELDAVLGSVDAALAARVWNVEPGGNFHDEASGESTGRNILHHTASLEELARREKLEPAELARRLESIRTRLFAAREKRIHPLKDDKVLTDWNGLMIAALAQGGRAFGEPRYVEAAARAADFVLAHLRTDDGRLLKRWRNGHAGLAGSIEDYAFFAWGLIELYESTGEPRWLAEALAVNRVQLARFHDAERGGFFTAADDAADLIARTKEAYDGALPSGNSVAALNLVRLARITGDTELEELAQETLRAFAGSVRRNPQAHTQILIALDFALGPSHEIVVAGDRGAADTRAMLTAIHRAFAPNKVVLLRADGKDALAELAPWTAEQKALGGRATAYVCRDFACERPTSDVAAVLASLAAVSKESEPRR